MHEESLFYIGLFHKTLWIRKLRICSYGQILTVNLLINCQNSIIYGLFVVNYEEKSFMEQAAMSPVEMMIALMPVNAGAASVTKLRNFVT